MKIKKIFTTIVALILSVSVFPMLNTLNAKADELSPADLCLLDFVADDIGDAEFTYQSSPLYDQNLTVNGYEYIFSVNGVQGFALIHQVQIGETLYYEIEELAYDGTSPFSASNGLPVYITFQLYLDYANGEFINLLTNTVISNEVLTSAVEYGFGYYGEVTFTEQIYSIHYDHKVQTVGGIQYGIPSYVPCVGAGCAQAAGAVLVAYYDQYCENLIPNYQSYLIFGENKVYKGETTETCNLMTELYTRMGAVNGGTTYSGFQAGMASYAQSKGYTYSTTSLLSNNALNFESYKTALSNGKPVALFLQNFALGGTEDGDGVDTVYSDVSPNTHVAIAYGYEENVYYNADNEVSFTQRYLMIASGLAIYGKCYLNITNFTTINNALAVTIA